MNAVDRKMGRQVTARVAQTHPISSFVLKWKSSILMLKVLGPLEQGVWWLSKVLVGEDDLVVYQFSEKRT